MTKVGVLGAGAWGFCLASVLANSGYEVVCWTRREELAQKLMSGEEHPHLPRAKISSGLRITTRLQDVLDGTHYLVESVTSAGIRSVFEQIRNLGGFPINL